MCHQIRQEFSTLLQILAPATVWLSWHPEYATFGLNVNTYQGKTGLTLYIHVTTIGELHLVVAEVPWDKPTTDSGRRHEGVQACRDEPRKYRSYAGYAFGGECVILSNELGDIPDDDFDGHCLEARTDWGACPLCNRQHNKYLSCDAAQQLSS